MVVKLTSQFAMIFHHMSIMYDPSESGGFHDSSHYDFDNFLDNHVLIDDFFENEARNESSDS